MQIEGREDLFIDLKQIKYSSVLNMLDNKKMKIH